MVRNRSASVDEALNDTSNCNIIHNAGRKAPPRNTNATTTYIGGHCRKGILLISVKVVVGKGERNGKTTRKRFAILPF